MKIVIGLVNLNPGGTEFQMCLLADELMRRGHEVTIYLTENIIRASNPMVLKFYHIPTRSTPPRKDYRGRRIPSIIHQAFYWRQYLHIDKPDVVIGALSLPHTLLALTSTSPIIGRRGFSWNELLQYPIYKRAFKRIRLARYLVIPRTKHMVCNASHVAWSTGNTEGWPSHKLEIIFNGWPEYSPIPYTSPRALYAGNGRIEKESDTFTLGIERTTSIPYWPSIGIYVHPTKAEGCSNSIGMAMAHGIPVIAYRTLGNIELLGDNYQALVNDEKNMAGWVKYLKDNEGIRKYIGAICLDRVRTHYPLRLMVDKWEGLLNDACKQD